MNPAAIGSFHIVRELGRGGMGVVYLATDTRLDRQVAIKALPEHLVNNHDPLARFEREAKIVASLNHPGIAAVYTLEQDGGKKYLVMEYVEGHTLASRLGQGPLPIDEALEVARQIAEALEAAHEKGVVHRDLKPANVMITSEGKVKVLDFGLARTAEGSASSTSAAVMTDSPTVTSPAPAFSPTIPGVIMGTVAYMSPEQARGKPVDRRSDIWAFGAVLREMLTGRPLFTGETPSDVLAAVVKDPIDLASLPSGTPGFVRRLLARCLERDPLKRLRDIGEARIALGSTEAEPAEVSTAAKPAPWRLAAAVVAALAVGALVAWSLKPADARRMPLRTFAIELPPPGSVVSGWRVAPAISHDGRMLAFTPNSAASTTLWIRDLSTLTLRQTAGTEGAAGPFWSPDASEAAYFTTGSPATLRAVPAAGGPSRLVCELPGHDARGGAWLRDGRIVFGIGSGDGEQSGSLYVVPARGGRAALYAAPDPTRDEHVLMYPSTLANGASLIFAASVGEHGGAIVLMDETGRRVLFEDPDERLAFPRHSPPGYLVYQRGFPQSKGVWALPFDARRLKVTGDPQLVDAEAESPAVAGDGTLVHGVSGAAVVPGQLVWVDRRGIVTAVDRVREGLGTPALAPDGRRVAFDAVEQGNRDVWLLDLERESVTRLTFDPSPDRSPVWTPGGRSLAFQSFRSGAGDIYLVPADGSLDAKLLVGAPRNDTPNAWTPDGHGLLYTYFADATAQDLMFAPVQDGSIVGEPQAFIQTARNEGWAHLAPDGQYAAYDSNESGQFEIYVTPFPGGGRRWQISSKGGSWPRWSPKGDEIFFIGGPSASGFGPIMAVPVSAQAGFQAGMARPLFDAPDRVNFAWFSVAADANRFLAVRQAADGRTGGTIVVVQNWPGRLGRSEGVPP